MSVSNLTGTKWIFGNSFSTLTIVGNVYSLNFSSNSNNYAEFAMVQIPHGVYVRYDGNAVYSIESGSGGWNNNAYRIISITGGTDATDTDLITWLEANATQVDVTDLTGTTWAINSTTCTVGYGSYEYLSYKYTNDSGTQYGMTWLLIGYRFSMDSGPIAMANRVTYMPANNAASIGDIIEFDSENAGTDATNPDLIVWLSQNATQQVTPTGNQYTVTHTLSNVTHGNVSFTIVPGSGYTLPASSADITVTGNGSLVSYDSTTGVVVVSGDDTVAISCECPAAPSGYEVTVTFTPGAVGYDTVYDGLDTSGTLLQSGGLDGTFTYTVESGYLSIFGTSINEDDEGTCTGGVTYMSASSSSGALHYQVSGNGSISGVWSNCFVKGTKITLADGTTKNVEDITYDDLLLVWDFYQAKLNAAKPCWIMKTKVADHYKKVTLSDGTVLKLVGQGENCHRLFNVTKQKMLYANECVGDDVYKQDGTIVTVLSCEKVYEEVEYYNLTTDTYLDCFANGVLTGSRLNNMYEIKDMKYTSMERLISAEEEQARWETRWKTQKPKC